MKSAFADTSYWIALLSPSDSLHERAQSISRTLSSVQIFTSEMIFVELLNDFSHRGPVLRATAVATIESLRRNPLVTIVPQSSILFQEALALYASRGDKDWSLTDCSSILIMQRYGIADAITHDGHFRQAGFTALLR